MSVQYRAINWNRQKRIYDCTLAAGVLAYLAVFAGLGAVVHPQATVETLLIRGLGTAGFVLLHLILAIGPLSRLDRRFLPLLYNRRHLGVTMFLLAAAHGVFSLVQFHALGNVSPLLSLFVSNLRYNSIPDFPFQGLGFFALLLLFSLASTSHDFWLHLLTPRVWKTLHMLVYVAYGLLVAHVLLGALQSETSALPAILVAAGLSALCSLHIAAGIRETQADKLRLHARAEGFLELCALESIPENRAKVFAVGSERVAVFRYGGKVAALSNVCRHQNGPLGEGRIIEGCVTCPWHGYQYDPETGASPPPFTDHVETYATRLIDGKVLLHPRPSRRDKVLHEKR